MLTRDDKTNTDVLKSPSESAILNKALSGILSAPLLNLISQYNDNTHPSCIVLSIGLGAQEILKAGTEVNFDKSKFLQNLLQILKSTSPENIMWCKISRQPQYNLAHKVHFYIPVSDFTCNALARGIMFFPRKKEDKEQILAVIGGIMKNLSIENVSRLGIHRSDKSVGEEDLAKFLKQNADNFGEFDNPLYESGTIHPLLKEDLTEEENESLKSIAFNQT